MKRRQLIRYGGISLLSAMGALSTPQVFAQGSKDSSSAVTIEYLGHTCFLFSGNGLNILVNPFRPAGCTAGYGAIANEPDIVLISSFLLDEGAIEDVPGNPQLFTEPGDYLSKGVKLQGITTIHDREGGRRFGKNLAWKWQQGGVNILHLGGIAAPISLEEKILMGTPDVLFIPVGGGAKAYNAQEAQKAIATLKPKVIIPTHYRTAAAAENCDLAEVDEFLNLSQGMEVKKLNVNRIAIKPSDLPQDKTVIRVLKYS